MNERRRAGIIAASLLGFGVVPSATGCTTGCTLMTCVTGFDVTFAGNVPPARTVRIEATGVDPVVVECTSPGICTGIPHIDGLHPEIVVVVLDAMGSELARETFHPDYQESRPNGRGCWPTCWVAVGVVTL